MIWYSGSGVILEALLMQASGLRPHFAQVLARKRNKNGNRCSK